MAKKTITSTDIEVPCTYSGTCRGVNADNIPAVTLTPYGESVADKLERGDWPVIWLENGKNYIEFTEFMLLKDKVELLEKALDRKEELHQEDLAKRKALAEEREEDCYSFVKAIDEKEKEIKRLNEKIKDLQDKVEVSDKSEDYRYERCTEAERKLLKIECFIKDKNYPYEK